MQQQFESTPCGVISTCARMPSGMLIAIKPVLKYQNNSVTKKKKDQNNISSFLKVNLYMSRTV